MGKPTGFLEYERETSTAVSPLERIKNFKEFHTPLSMEVTSQIAAFGFNLKVHVFKVNSQHC